MMQWETKKLEDLADFYLGKMLDKKKNKGDYRPYLANVNVRWGGFELDDLREMRFEDREKERYGLEYGDIVMCEGGEPGRCAIWKNQIPGMMFQKALHRIRPSATLDYRFLYYSLLNRGQEGGFDQYCTGATIKHLPRQNLAKVDVAVPPLETQQAIASILSAYDDLIENNTRRIEILEEMARRLYEEWFVHFRFPGHEEVSFKESELGEIPEGWEVCKLIDLVDFIGGAQPPKSQHIYEVKEGYVRFVQNRDYRSDGHLTYIPESKRNKICGRLDILVDKYGEAGKARFGIAGAYNVALAKIVPKGDYYREWLRGLFSRSQTQEYLLGASQAATRPSLNKAHFNFPVSLPSESVAERFSHQVLPMLKLMLALKDKTTNLRAQRDLLLPKLVSGEIDVSDIPMPNDKEVDAA